MIRTRNINVRLAAKLDAHGLVPIGIDFEIMFCLPCGDLTYGYMRPSEPDTVFLPTGELCAIGPIVAEYCQLGDLSK